MCQLESMQAYSDHKDCPFCHPPRQICAKCQEEFTPVLDETLCPTCDVAEEGLCQSCKEFVFPEEGFCPICGEEFVDIKDMERS